MNGIIIAALVILLLLAVCVIDYSARKIVERVTEICHRADRSIADMKAEALYLVALRDEIEKLAETANDVESNK